MSKPTAVVVGFIGKLPLAGMALANTHTLIGLAELGYHVHYVERQNGPLNLYDPHTDQMTDDPTVALRYLQQLLQRHGFSARDFSFIDLPGRCHGSGWPRLKEVLASADFVLDMGDASWFDELALCSRRAFVDADPMFTQVGMLNAQDRRSRVIQNYDTVFSIGVRIGEPDCPIPAAGRQWKPTTAAVATRFWKADTKGAQGPVTTLMNWASGPEARYGGTAYGYKDREFEKFMTLPSRIDRACAVAMGGDAPRERLSDCGWQVMSALTITRSIESYKEFIMHSAADIGIAKHAYVESNCGWFSDRSTCYLAAGRPVLHQDTGIGEWLPTGEGVLLFSTLEEAVDRLRELELDYTRHARAARAVAEEYFEASKVLRKMLDDAGWS